MGMTNYNLRRAFERPAPPAPMRYIPGRSPAPLRMPVPIRFTAPLPWYYRIDPILLLLVMLAAASPLVVLALLLS